MQSAPEETTQVEPRGCRRAWYRVTALSLAIMFSVAPSVVVWSQEDYSDELPRIAPTEASETIANFTVADGFQIELVAAEPLVATPVAIEWAADGSMYVCEMRGYSENRDDRLSRVRRLTDSDHDGVYDQSKVFVDGLLWPTAIFPFDGGLFIGDAPDLLYCKDTDGDGIADVKNVVLTGFGTSNVQGLMNSFRWGLDNRIHIACSSVGGSVHRPGDAEGALEVRRRDLAFDPRTFEIEQTSGGAQHGMCFDDWGHKFASSNSDHIQQVMYEDRYVARNKWFSAAPARVSIAADGPQAEVFRTSPVEPWRIVRTRLRVGGVVPGPIEGGGRAAGYFTGATGVTIYRGDAWPARWKGLAIVGDVGSNLIHRKRLEANGVQMIARRIDEGTEFVSSSDIWFRPAQFANAPDGTLHVVDVCREVIEHPKSLPEPIKRHLDLTSGRDRGRIYRIVASDSKVARRSPARMDSATASELVSLLEHPNAWHRETAARLLFERQDRTMIDEVRRLAADSSLPQGRLHAMYVLDGIDALDSATLLPRLKDDHPQVRRHAVRLSENESGISGELNRRLAELTEDPSIEVRYQLAFSLGSIDHPDRIELLTRLVRRDVESPWMRLAVQSSLAEGAADVFVSLASNPEFRSGAAAEFLGDLASQIRKQGDPDGMRRGLQTVEALTESDPLFALPVATQLIGSSKGGEGSVPSEQSIGRLVSTLTRSASAVATDSDRDTADRVQAVRALALAQWDDIKGTLVLLIDNREPIDVQRASIETIGRFASPGVAELLLGRWDGLSPSLRQLASEVLFARPDRTEALYDAIDRGELAMADLPRERLTIAANSSNPRLKTRSLEFLRRTAGPSRTDVIARYREATTVGGDVSRGRNLFKKHCAACHRVEGQGHELGPNLATIKTRGAETILVNVLDPNAEVNPEYLNYAVLMTDGRTITGMIASENANSITLRRAEGASDTVLRDDIEQMQSTGKSIMPEGMEQTLDVQGMADLIAYLMQVK